MLDGIWSGGTYVCYGMDNREAPIRLCNAASPHSRNFEFRTMDGTANPYIALAAIFGVGLEAIIEGKKLEAKNCSDGRTAAEMTEIERAAMGITERLPLNLKEARKRTGESMPVKKVFGANFVQKYLSVNEVSFRVGLPCLESLIIMPCD
jgi:glutamine synthetase